MSPASTDPSMMTVAGPAPLRPTVLVGAGYTRQHANLLAPGQIVFGLVSLERLNHYRQQYCPP
jgi:hypothetical protein